MKTLSFCTATSLLALLSLPAPAQDVRVGKAAYGDWQTDAPGVTRKITVNDLSAPLETPPGRNFSKIIDKPTGATPKTMPGFLAAPFVTEMRGARVIRVAPNGDIFLSRYRA